jgi:hypothetical protein
MYRAIIKDWGFTLGGDQYTPPECRYLALVGVAVAHDRKTMDGKYVRTSRVTGARGRVVTTQNSEYTLEGPPCEAYAAWLKEKGLVLTEDDPLRDVLEANGMKRLP